MRLYEFEPLIKRLVIVAVQDAARCAVDGANFEGVNS
jgi:hypothetical protein